MRTMKMGMKDMKTMALRKVNQEVKGQVSLNHGNKSVNKCSVDDDSEDIGTKRQTQSVVKEAGASGKTVRNQKKANSDTLSIFC